MELLFSRVARHDQKRLSPEIGERVVDKLNHYRNAPDPLVFAKRLHNDPNGTHRFQIGDWRAKFFVDKNTIVITRIRHRSNAYRSS